MRNNALDALNPIKCIHTLKNILKNTKHKRVYEIDQERRG